MEKIKQILMQNSLYKSDEIIKPANYNKIEEFLNTYEYNGSRKQKLPNNLSRDDDGRIILEEIPFIKTNVTPNGDRDNEWLILNNGTKLLTKAGREHKYNIDELVIMYFLKSINIDCANYDIATLNDKELLIVPSFLQDNEKIKTTFQKVPDIEEAYQEMKSSNARTFFLKTIFADRIYGNVERFPVNFGNIISIHPNKETHERICPLFDNATKYGLFFRENKYFNFPSIGPKNDSAFDKVINHLLGYEEIMHWMHGPVKKATLYKATERLYKEKGIYVDNDIYKEFETFFKDSEAIINDELKNKGTSLKNKISLGDKMNKEIINVLEENKIYDDYYNEIEIYNEKEFLFHYKFNNTHIHKIPSSIKRNKDGLLKLDDEPFIKNIYKSNGHNTAYWILFDNGSKVLLKEVDYGETCMELLFMELAKAINIPSAKYDVAILNGKTYLASVCFTGVDDLIFDYYDVENKQDIFIEDLIKKAKNINQENFVKKTLTIDLLTNHQDRFPHNFAVILRNRKELICPLFDNGLCGLYRKKFYTLPSYKHSILPKDIMSFLLEDEKVKDWCLKKVLKQDVRNYRENIMKEKGLFIDENMNDLFTENVENGKQMIANIIKK